MLSVYICEDDLHQRSKIETIIKNYLMIEEYNMTFVLSTDSPDKLLQSVKETSPIGLYFLDIDLKDSLSGINLATEIRKYDSFGKIVFITSHDEMMPEVFRYQVEAMDYIVKTKEERLSKRIHECLSLANSRYQSDLLASTCTVTL